MIIGGLIAMLVIWEIGVQRRLMAMDEHVNNAMSQIGLSSRFNALTALLVGMFGFRQRDYLEAVEGKANM